MKSLQQKYIPRGTEYQVINFAQRNVECFACSTENLNWTLRDEQKFSRRQMKALEKQKAQMCETA